MSTNLGRIVGSRIIAGTFTTSEAMINEFIQVAGRAPLDGDIYISTINNTIYQYNSSASAFRIVISLNSLSGDTVDIYVTSLASALNVVSLDKTANLNIYFRKGLNLLEVGDEIQLCDLRRVGKNDRKKKRYRVVKRVVLTEQIIKKLRDLAHRGQTITIPIDFDVAQHIFRHPGYMSGLNSIHRRDYYVRLQRYTYISNETKEGETLSNICKVCFTCGRVNKDFQEPTYSINIL